MAHEISPYLMVERKKNNFRGRDMSAAQKARWGGNTFFAKHRISLAMTPGLWYARPDLVRVRDVRAVVNAMWKQGLLERVFNPEWNESQELTTWREPMYLYRLTPAGEALRREAERLA